MMLDPADASIVRSPKPAGNRWRSRVFRDIASIPHWRHVRDFFYPSIPHVIVTRTLGCWLAVCFVALLPLRLAGQQVQIRGIAGYGMPCRVISCGHGVEL